jgi:hypothetical protein
MRGYIGRDLLELRQKAVVIVAVPLPNDPYVEVYGQTRQEAVEVLMTWSRSNLLLAVGMRKLQVPRRATRQRLAQELVAAGPAWFCGEHGVSDDMDF